jgi:peptidyl-prolyl cis-trans isomerase D
MLQLIRDRSQGLIVGVIVFLISLTFALWGIQSYVSAGARVIVAEVNGKEIELREFQDALQRLRRQAQSLLGESFDSADWTSEAVKERALNDLINARLVEDLTEDSRIRVSDAQVARQIQKMPSFQDENGFSRRLYEQRVPLYGFSELGFEHEMRRDLERGQLRAGIAASEFVTVEEAQHIAMLRKQKRDIGYSIIPASAFRDEVKISDADLEKYFGKRREDYRTQEKALLEYLEISPAALASEVKVNDSALRAHYEANKAAYTFPEERNVNHILVQVAERADIDTVLAAQLKVEEAVKRAEAGEAFEDLARELSDDVGSKTEGGETGFFPRGVMAPEFEEAAFALDVGKVSEPVRTRFGYHLIKVKEVKPGGLKPFEDVRAEVEEGYRAIEAQKLFFEQADQFSNLVYEHPDNLDVAAEALGLEAKRTEALTRPEIEALFAEKVAAAAFEPEVLIEGLNSEPIELEDGRVVAVRVIEHTPSHIPALDDVKSAVTEALRNERMRELTEAAGQDIIMHLRAGGTVSDLLQEQGFGWERVEAADRESNDVNRAVLRAAFRAEVPENAPVYTGIPIGNADYAVIRIANVVTPPVDEIDSLDIVETTRQLLGSRTNETWQEFIESLRASSDVEVFPENL